MPSYLMNRLGSGAQRSASTTRGVSGTEAARVAIVEPRYRMNTLESKNGRCGGLHHRVTHNGSSAFMDRISLESGVICSGQQTIESYVAACSQRGTR